MKAKTVSFTLLLKLILPLAAVILFICYLFAIGPAIAVYKSYSSLKKIADGSGNLSVSPTFTASRKTQVDTLFKQFQVDTLKWKNTLWNCGAVLSRKFDCKIVAYPPLKSMLFNDRKVGKQSIGFNGDFISLLKIVNEIEHTKGIGKLNWLSYNKKNNDSKTTVMMELVGIMYQDE